MENRACGERAPCVLHDAWEEELSTILEYLGAQTLDEFVAGTASGKLFSQTLLEDRPVDRVVPQPLRVNRRQSYISF
jgi:DNA-binding IscR family transcriptional regulator